MGNPVMFFDPSGLKNSYILYSNDSSSSEGLRLDEQAIDMKNKLKGLVDGDIIIHKVNSAEDFKYYWNKVMPNDEEIGQVVVISYGVVAHEPNENNYGIGTLKFYDGSSLYAGSEFISSDTDDYNKGADISVNELKSKNIDFLYFSSCNTGNIDAKINIAKAFRNNNPQIEVIGAWDGGVAYVPKYGKILGIAIGGYLDKPTNNTTTVDALSDKKRNPLGYIEF